MSFWRPVGRCIGENGAGRFDSRAAAEWRPTRQHLVEDHSQREDVRSGIDFVASDLLGRHIADRPQHDARFRLLPRSSSPMAYRACAIVAIPKSRILTRPSRVMNRFSGLMSRWTIARS